MHQWGPGGSGHLVGERDSGDIAGARQRNLLARWAFVPGSAQHHSRAVNQ